MSKYGLKFISDKDLLRHTTETANKYRFSIDLTEFTANTIDPIKFTFDSIVYDITEKEAIDREVARQLDKSNSNHIGLFHQNIFRYIGDGWSVPNSGYDVVHETNRHYVEMKNKHNTMNSSSSQKTYMRMQNTLLSDNKATCMLVEVIARKSQNAPWKCSVDGQALSSDRIRRVSIDQFYKLVTGYDGAFKDLCQVLPSVIADVVKTIDFDESSNTVLRELVELSPDLLKSLYLLAFENYEGFGELEFKGRG